MDMEKWKIQTRNREKMATVPWKIDNQKRTTIIWPICSNDTQLFCPNTHTHTLDIANFIYLFIYKASCISNQKGEKNKPSTNFEHTLWYAGHSAISEFPNAKRTKQTEMEIATTEYCLINLVHFWNFGAGQMTTFG